MPFQYTFRADDITTWEAETRDLLENRDRELELYSTTIDNSFLNLNASNLTSGTVPSARMTGAYTGITDVGTLGSLTVTGDLTVDTNTLRVDSANNRVGINVTSPTSNLDLVGNQVIRNAATQDGIQLAGRAGGTTSLTVKLIPDVLTTNRTITLPNTTGTIITTGNLSSITSVGTLGTLNIGGAGQNRWLTIDAPTGFYAIQYFAINGVFKWHYEVNPAGDRWSLVQTGVAERIGVDSARLTFDGAGSPSIAIGDWSASSGFSSIVTSKGYLLLGATSGNDNVYLRSTGSTTSVNLGVGGITDTLQILLANSTTSVRVTGGVRVYGSAGAFEFENRTGAGEYFGWYSTGGDALLYSSYLAANVIGVARTTGITYLYRGVIGNIQYGSYGSITMYGSNGGWAGISFPDTTSAMMLQNTYFGHYRNNTTWNFYVNNGTFVPSDERYKRDIEPLQHGMNLIREIVPVTYDPLTESLDDDPETTVGKTHYGFTTQNILQALSNAGETRDVAVVDIGGPSTEGTNSDRQYLNHSALIAPMVKAIQELDARLQQLETT